MSRAVGYMRDRLSVTTRTVTRLIVGCAISNGAVYGTIGRYTANGTGRGKKLPRDPKGWVLGSVLTGTTGIGLIAGGVAQSFDYVHESSPHWTVLTSHCSGAALFGITTRPTGRCAVIRADLQRMGKPVIENPTVAELQAFILDHAIIGLLVDGTDSKAAREQVEVVLSDGLLPF